MNETTSIGWPKLVEGFPWFAGEGRFPLPAYSEFMPPPRLGLSPYGAADPLLFSSDDPFGWHITEIEEEYELVPGLHHLADQFIGALATLSKGQTPHAIAGHQRLNFDGNPYWPPELAARSGSLEHERCVALLPLALSRTQDELGRIRWTFFGSSEQGPEYAFWKSFFSAPDVERPEGDSLAFISGLLAGACGVAIDGAVTPRSLRDAGFRILPSDEWPGQALPRWTRPFILDAAGPLDGVRWLLTFRPFAHLPDAVRAAYLAGRLNLLPFPGSLVFWGMPTYRRLARRLPDAMQIPLLRLAGRHGGPDGIRVAQSGWIHVPQPSFDSRLVQPELLHDSYVRTHRWGRVHRYEDEIAANPRVDKIAKVLFSTALDAIGLYDKPMARNCQLWTHDFGLLLDGPAATREDLTRAEKALADGGLFGYRFQFPPMRVGQYAVYWHRPLVAYPSPTGGGAEVMADGLLGCFTATRTDASALAHPVELWPRRLQREVYLAALREFRHDGERYRRQTALNALTLLDARELEGRPLPRSLARRLLRVSNSVSLDDWLGSLPSRARERAAGGRIQSELNALLEPQPEAPPPGLTYEQTASRAFEEAWWNDIATLSHGRYLTKDNADCVQDAVTQEHLSHHQRDLDRLAEYLLGRHRAAIVEAGLSDRAFCGELPFAWQTDFPFSSFGGWVRNQSGPGCERDILAVIPGRNRAEAVVMADHYDTAYMEDVYDPKRGGSGARLAAAGADDNHSATSTLLRAAPIFLNLAKEGRLERDVWLLHLTGEEFPSDCLGARHFCRALVEKTLRLRRGGGEWTDLSSTRVAGVVLMDMIAHNREDEQDVFQISPGKSAISYGVARQAHLANEAWNAGCREWNGRPDRSGKGRGRRSPDGVTMPGIAVHPHLRGEVRTADDPMSSLYNTDGQIFSDVGVPVVLFMENYDINRTGYHDTHDTLENIDLDYGSAVAAIAIETVARLACLKDV